MYKNRELWINSNNLDDLKKLRMVLDCGPNFQKILQTIIDLLPQLKTKLETTQDHPLRTEFWSILFVVAKIFKESHKELNGVQKEIARRLFQESDEKLKEFLSKKQIQILQSYQELTANKSTS